MSILTFVALKELNVGACYFDVNNFFYTLCETKDVGDQVLLVITMHCNETLKLSNTKCLQIKNHPFSFISFMKCSYDIDMVLESDGSY